MKYKAKLKENDNWATGYYLQVEGEERHFLILNDAELVDNDFAGCLVIHGWVEIDPDTLQPVQRKPECNCHYFRGGSAVTPGWYCPVHGQQF